MSCITVRGARTHNLRDVDVEIPRGKLVVITGPSGSGKSSLAFDTIFAEGQRRYVESLSPHARQFLGKLSKPDVDFIDGLSPTIAIDQRSAGRNPRSTVGTATEIHDFVRVLFARAGKPHCPGCNKPLNPMTVDEMVDRVEALPKGVRFSVLAPAARGQKGNLSTLLKRLKRDGFARVLIDGEVHDLFDEIKLDKRSKHDLDIYVDRLVNEEGIRNRLADSIELALEEAEGLVTISVVEGDDLYFTSNRSCSDCNITLERMEPANFSFNNPAGACKRCNGLGRELHFDEKLLIPDPAKPLAQDAIEPWSKRNTAYYKELLTAAATVHGIDLFTPWKELTENQQRVILHGAPGELEFTVEGEGRRMEFKRELEGVIPNLERRKREHDRRKSEGANPDDLDYLNDEFHKYMREETCSVCKGARLNTASLHVTVGEVNIAQLGDLTINECEKFFRHINLPPPEDQIAAPLITEIAARLSFLSKVGLDYLTMGRPTSTLSGGEAQRIRLATQIGSALVGVTYVLDEPSIGLHQRDNDRLVRTLKELVQKENTVLVVEHDGDTIESADLVIDMGPGAGVTGGRITAMGTPKEIKKNPSSLTGRYLSGEKSIPIPVHRRKPRSRVIEISGATTNNLKNVTARFPVGLTIAVTGVSGSGKSSLVVDTLLPALKNGPGVKGATWSGIKGAGHIDKVIDIDQSAIGRTPRSNPATFTGVFTSIRDIFAGLPESKTRGYKPGRYSFNVKGGRCEACQGDGLIRVEMSFLPDAFVTCEVCKGRRYNRETLEVKLKGMSIADVLDMTCNQAYDFLENFPAVRQKLGVIREVGLGYLRLGQNAATLSGGEAQRLKLAKELSRRATGRTLYVLDEPTTGLHFQDVERLMEVLDQLVDQGNTLVVIEHNLDVIKRADWVIEMGPEGGGAGGHIVATGIPEDIAAAGCPTGRYLTKVLGPK